MNVYIIALSNISLKRSTSEMWCTMGPEIQFVTLMYCDIIKKQCDALWHIDATGFHILKNFSWHIDTPKNTSGSGFHI